MLPGNKGTPPPPPPLCEALLRQHHYALSLKKSSSVCLSTPVYSPPSLGPRGTGFQTHLRLRTARALPSRLTLSPSTCRDGSWGHTLPVSGLGHHHPSPILSHAGLIPPPASGSGNHWTQAFFLGHHVTQFKPRQSGLAFLDGGEKTLFSQGGELVATILPHSLSQHGKKQS